MLAGLHAVTEEQLDKMAEYLEAYQDQCSVCSFFLTFNHFQVFDCTQSISPISFYRKCRNSMAKTSTFQSKLLHHTLVMTLPIRVQHTTTVHVLERGSNKNPGRHIYKQTSRKQNSR